MKITKQAFENPFTDDFEIMLRHIMCVFLTIETTAVCYYITLLTLNGDTIGNTITLLKFHETSLKDAILTPLIFCTIFISMTLLSILYKTAYLVYDGMHALLGLLFFVYGSTFNEFSFELFAVLFVYFAILSARFTIYLIITEINKSNIMKKQHKTSPNDS